MTEDGSFDVVPVAVSAYAHHPEIPAGKEVQRIADLLTVDLHAVVAASAADLQTESRIKERLHEWAERGDRSSIVLWIGHGTSNLSGAWLATYETPLEVAHSGVHPRTLADLMVKQWQRRRPYDGVWSAVFIEACGAADFARKLSALLLDAPEVPARYAVVGVGNEYGATSLGHLHAVLQAALDKTYTDNDGPQIPTRELISNLASRLYTGTAIHHGLHTANPIRRRVLLPVAVTAPIDVYGELRAFLADLPPDERHHFISKAQGAEHSELAWYFVGRHAEHRRLAGWLRTERAGLLVVTGDAGCGKSALLGNLLLRTNPALHQVLVSAGQLEAAAADEMPPAAVFDVVVQLTGFKLQTLVTRLASACGVLLAAGGATTADADRLVAALAARKRPTTFLADALDEAQEPLAIADLLRRLADLLGMRVVVGTRRSTQEGPDLPASDHEDLLDILGRRPATWVLVVDRDPGAIADYLRKRLNAAVRTGQLAADEGAIGHVTTLIGHRDRHFLFARLAVHEILARPELLTSERRDELNDLLSRDHRTLFAAAVDRLDRRSPAFRPLLQALAEARGRGVPRQDRTWIVMANALTPAPSASIREADVDELCELAAPYIMLDAENGQSVYRLAHRTFQEHFRNRAGDQRQ